MKNLLLAAIIIPYVIDFKIGAGTPQGCWHFNVRGQGGRSNLDNLDKWTCSIPKPTQEDIEAWSAEYDADMAGKATYERPFNAPDPRQEAKRAELAALVKKANDGTLTAAEKDALLAKLAAQAAKTP